ncbi:hypothetical protein PC9H_000788 [Pleurotus ostreatus]|uniref:Uncharacterized protein n=2 Tax=Pleurotus ostreatus TaxID=5322 RepID=A0A067NYU2_PLEO1|nr:uncharacterized protein PC9H_000788 [Pleurotus ostreatus]KAF7440443.1 hypothetical protein PC9H_000788 [Pleurotus ostreatus]KAJ8700220.1 hypothetical protein PTI98_003267 [Pleurotus ostreatus]KDQ33238.1 hypothetical protein PLEOSDRAFT_1060911 [Pleurotus ostreatus PC15]
MQALRRICRPTQRSLSTTPWFVDTEAFLQRPPPPHLTENPLTTRPPPLPKDVPHSIKELHSQLASSPHLEPSTIVVDRSLGRVMGPPLPLRKPQGRRKRGGTNAGESAFDIPGGVWNWVVLAQVKEGTESKGGIESVVRLVRKTLLGMSPPLPLGVNPKKKMHNGWAMVDAGDFAVHVLSKQAKERYFTQIEGDQW